MLITFAISIFVKFSLVSGISPFIATDYFCVYLMRFLILVWVNICVVSVWVMTQCNLQSSYKHPGEICILRTNQMHFLSKFIPVNILYMF
jgi:hypothetical protein